MSHDQTSFGACRKQFRLFVVGVFQLVASFACALILGENAIHRSHAAQVVALIEQLGVNLPR